MALGRKRVLILGGGYAGVRVAHDLAKSTERTQLEIVMISATPEHLEIPSLYEVAAAYVSHESMQASRLVSQGVAVSLHELFAQLPVAVRHGYVDMIRPADRFVTLTDKTVFSYDYLVIGLGAEVATYNIPGVAESAFQLKTLADALRLRHHAMKMLLTEDEVTFVVIGGGATGVETAAELVGLARHVIRDRHFTTKKVRVVLAEAGPEILRETPSPLREKALGRLRKLGVEVMTNRTVEQITDNYVIFKDGGSVMSHITIWAGGLKPHDVLIRSGLPIKAWGVSVEKTLQVVGQPLLFAAGDSAMLSDPTVRIPATVPVAYTQGALVARNIRHFLKQEPLEEFHYHKLPQLITLGGKNALMISPAGHGFTGFWPWLAKHLVSFRYWLRYLSFFSALKLWYHGVRQMDLND